MRVNKGNPQALVTVFIRGMSVVVMFSLTFLVSIRYDEYAVQLWLLVANVMSVINLLDFGLTPNYTRFCSYASCGFRRVGSGPRRDFGFKLQEVCSTGIYMYIFAFICSSIFGWFYFKHVTAGADNSSSLAVLVSVALLIPSLGFYKYICATFVGAGRVLVKNVSDAVLALLLLCGVGYSVFVEQPIESVIFLRYLVPLLLVSGLLLYVVFFRAGIPFWRFGSLPLARELYSSSLKTGVGAMLSKGTLLFVTAWSVKELVVIASSQLLFTVQIAFAAQGLAVTFASVQSKKIAKNVGDSNLNFRVSCFRIMGYSLSIFLFVTAFGYAAGRFIPEMFGRVALVGSIQYYAILVAGLFVELINIVLLLFVSFRGLIVTHILCFLQMLVYFMYLFVFKDYLDTEVVYYSIFMVGPLLVGLPISILSYRRVMRDEVS